MPSKKKLIEVVWKTSDKWCNVEHSFKRKEIKPKDLSTVPMGKNASNCPLRTGQRVRVKFGAMWYDAELKEDWPPKEKQDPQPGSIVIPNSGSEHSAEDMEAEAEDTDVEYLSFLKKQAGREKAWAEIRQGNLVDIDVGESSHQAEGLEELKKKIAHLEMELQSEKEKNNDHQKTLQKQDAILEGIAEVQQKLSDSLPKIFQQLEALQHSTISFSTEQLDLSALDLPISSEDLAPGGEGMLFTTSTPTRSIDSLVQEPQRELETPSIDRIVGTCVSLSKLARIKRGLELATERHKCALKLLDDLFCKRELGSSNIKGVAGKDKLDEARIGIIKRLTFVRFPAESAVEEEQEWRTIQKKIDAKCRFKKHQGSRPSTE